mmetsp:Transcript_15931/g.42905  ORF Transcript_15931/g.42905 Transcript_15931/m.42905 type:complete len:410 (+) Transcript_15931:98-1327(+)
MSSSDDSADSARAREGHGANVTFDMCHRILYNPYIILVVFLAMVAMGMGMVGPMVVESEARTDGKWYPASCTIVNYVFSPKEEHLQAYDNPKTAMHKGADYWYFIGAFNVSVRFNDGCDGSPDHTPNALAEQRMQSEEVYAGSFERRLSPPPSAVSGAPPPSAPVPVRSPPPALSPPDALDLPPELLSDSQSHMVPHRTLRHRSPDGPQASPGCTTEEARKDPMRGHHIAFYNLVLSEDDFCLGPVHMSEAEALRYCENTSGDWFHHRHRVAERLPCWIFEKHVSRDDLRAHVVLHRGLPTHIYIYLSYWVFLLFLFARVTFLFVLSALQRYGLWPRDPVDEEMRMVYHITSHTVDHHGPTHGATGADGASLLTNGLGLRAAPLKSIPHEVDPALTTSFRGQRAGNALL